MTVEENRIDFGPSIGPAEILPWAAQRHPDKTALVTGDRRWTYRQLDDMSNAFALALQQRGISGGSVVSLYGQNSAEWLIAYHGTLKAGAVVNPVNVMLTGPELSYVLNDCQSRVLLAGAEQAEVADNVISGVESLELFGVFDDSRPRAASFSDLIASRSNRCLRTPGTQPLHLCSIAYTSGTTGHPKGVMQSHRSVLLNCALTATMHGRAESDIVVTALPCAHVYGNVVINSTFIAGGTVVLMERFRAAEALRLIGTERATIFDGVPAMYAMVLSDDALAQSDLTSLRMCTVGGQTSPPELIDRWQQRAGVPLIEVWGMTEISGLGTTHSVYAPRAAGSIGVALPGIEVRVAPLDGSNAEIPTGERGELVVRGPVVMLGYHGRPEATAEVLSPDGWLRTGDVAHVDDTGHFFIVDRIKDMIVTAGYNVYPAEIERVIATHPDVSMVGVGRRHDDVRGEVAVAYVVPRRGAALGVEAVMDHCRTHLAAYKRPRAVEIVATLPTTSSGKVMRRRLNELGPETSTVNAGQSTEV
jgi:long-chain acyl-CoA synthetase